MKTTVITVAFCCVSSVTLATPLAMVNANAPAVNCVFDPTCTIVVDDSTGDIVLPGGAGTGFLQSRTFTAQPGSPAEGFYGYEYRIDLRDIMGILAVPCVTSFSISFGTAVSFDYDGDGSLERVYVVTTGGLGNVGPSSADKVGNTITFSFAAPVCAGETSFFFGMASAHPPQAVTAHIRESLTGTLLALGARAPMAPSPSCAPRPDLNDDFTADERATLAGLIQQFLTSGILDLHFTPGIHGTSLFLPWHREYIGDLEAFLIVEGHPEFVPLPKWNPANEIPAEFTVVDADCSAPPTCDPLVNTDPNDPLPVNLQTPDICSNYGTIEDLRLGPPFPGLESYHNGVHVDVSGAMGAFNSPAAIIFWPWHAFVDDVWRSWECCPRISIPLPFAIDSLIQRPCLLRPCWTVWFGLDDPRLLDPTGLTVNDRRGFANVGMLVGDPRPVPGMVGGALAFDGIDDYVHVPDQSELNVGVGDLSIDAWIRTAAMGLRPIVTKQDSAWVGYALFLMDGRLGFQLGGGLGDFTMDSLAAVTPSAMTFIAPIGSPNVADGMWHHVAVSVDRDTVGMLYVDSVPVLKFDPTAIRGDASNTADLMIARSASGRLFAGKLDEIDIFRFALTEDEIDGIFTAGSAGKYGSLAGFKPMVRGPCLKDLRQVIVNLPRVNVRGFDARLPAINQMLLAHINRAISLKRNGNVDAAKEILESLHATAHSVNGHDRYDLGVYETIAEKTQECLASLNQ